VKTISTIFIAPLIMGLAVGVFVLSSIGHEGYGVFQLVPRPRSSFVGWFDCWRPAEFRYIAPIYWFLGRLHSKKSEARDETW